MLIEKSKVRYIYKREGVRERIIKRMTLTSQRRFPWTSQ